MWQTKRLYPLCSRWHFFYRSLFGSNLVFTSLECHKRTIFDTMRQISTMVVTVFIAAYQHIINKLLVRIQSDKVNSHCNGIPPVGPSWVLDPGRVGNFLGELHPGDYFLEWWMPSGTCKLSCVVCNSVGKIMRHVSNRMRFSNVVPSSGVDLQVFWRQEVLNSFLNKALSR